jgi:hypothetical protein
MDDDAASGTAAEAAPNGVAAAIDSYIRTQMLSLVSDESRHCQLIGCVVVECWFGAFRV